MEINYLMAGLNWVSKLDKVKVNVFSRQNGGCFYIPFFIWLTR